MYLYLYFKYFFGWLLVLVLKILLQSILPNTVKWFVGASRAWRLYSQITPVPDARLSGTNTLNILIYFFLPTERVLLELSWTYYRQKIP